jgi:type I restriction-modification system DNA methylase subunit
LLQTVFWLVSAKTLRDKKVQRFEGLVTDVDEVFRRVGNHYGTRPLVAGSRKKVDALRESANIIGSFSSLVLTTTEALAYVYENTLISKETRSALGTYRTPSFLVDCVVGNMAEWVEEIPVNDRSVFEPSCGHAAFLVSAMRLLTELLPAAKQIPSRRGPYLRSCLHGTDIDPFALELARLSLTLTDIPNPDGWDLKVQDMFLEELLTIQAKKNTVLLANLPFDDFSPQEQQAYEDESSKTRFVNKSC